MKGFTRLNCELTELADNRKWFMVYAVRCWCVGVVIDVLPVGMGYVWLSLQDIFSIIAVYGTGFY